MEADGSVLHVVGFAHEPEFGNEISQLRPLRLMCLAVDV